MQKYILFVLMLFVSLAFASAPHNIDRQYSPLGAGTAIDKVSVHVVTKNNDEIDNKQSYLDIEFSDKTREIIYIHFKVGDQNTFLGNNQKAGDFSLSNGVIQNSSELRMFAEAPEQGLFSYGGATYFLNDMHETTRPAVIPESTRLEASVPSSPKELFAQITLEDYGKLSQRPGVYIVEFGAKWCLPCMAYQNTLKKLQIEYPTIVIYTVDIDSNPVWQKQFKNQVIPQTIAYRNGQVEFSKSEALSLEELKHNLGLL